jgi:UPF0755 protein
MLKKKSVKIIVGLVLFCFGIVLLAPVFSNFTNMFLKGYGFKWGIGDFFLVVTGGFLIFMGFVILFLQLKRHGGFWLMVIIAIIIISIGTGVYTYTQVVTNLGYVDKQIDINIDPKKAINIEIPLGTSSEKISKILQENGVIGNPGLFKLLSKFNGFDGRYKAGTHILSKELDYISIMRVLASKPESIKVTIPEGKTIKQISKILQSKNLINVDEFSDAIKKKSFNYSFIKDIPSDSNGLEGYLFPDTYEFSLKTGYVEIINTMLDNFDKKLKPEYLKRAKEIGMTLHEVITLASIIERESGNSEDRKMISAIFHKRLNAKTKYLQKLQSCATIQYILLNETDEVKQKITISDTEIDNPYNTYKYSKLPPGPICSPGIDSIIAVLYPAENLEGNWYFLAIGDGKTVFSKTYNEQLKQKKKYGVGY